MDDLFTGGDDGFTGDTGVGTGDDTGDGGPGEGGTTGPDDPTDPEDPAYCVGAATDAVALSAAVVTCVTACGSKSVGCAKGCIDAATDVNALCTECVVGFVLCGRVACAESCTPDSLGVCAGCLAATPCAAQYETCAGRSFGLVGDAGSLEEGTIGDDDAALAPADDAVEAYEACDVYADLSAPPAPPAPECHHATPCPPVRLVSGKGIVVPEAIPCVANALREGGPVRVRLERWSGPNKGFAWTETIAVFADRRAASTGNAPPLSLAWARTRQILRPPAWFRDCGELSGSEAFACLAEWSAGCDDESLTCIVDDQP